MSKIQQDSSAQQLSLISDTPQVPEKKNEQVEEKNSKKGFTNLGSLLHRFTLEDKGGFITKEFQDYGYRLAVELQDPAHKSLYIKLAKDAKLRPLVERALSFVADADSARNKARLFMWKLQQLKSERKKADEEKT